MYVVIYIYLCIYIYTYVYYHIQSLSIYIILHPHIGWLYYHITTRTRTGTKALSPPFVGHAQLAARHIGQAPCSAQTLEERPEIMAGSLGASQESHPTHLTGALGL